MLRPRRQAFDVSERQRALRRIELALLRVALENFDNVALAGGDNDQIGVGCVFVEIGGCRLLVLDRAAALFQFLHPARKFQPLVDRLRRLVEQAVPFDRLVARSVRRRNDEADRIHRRTFLVPEIQSKLAFVTQRLIEHALARHHPAVADVVTLAVLHQPHVVAGRKQAIAKLQARLAAADDCNHSLCHCPLLYKQPSRGRGFYSINKGIAGSARSGPIAV